MEIMVNAIYVFFWTTARKRVDLTTGSVRAKLGQRALAFAKQTEVLLTLRFRVCCTHMNAAVASSVVILYPIGPE